MLEVVVLLLPVFVLIFLGMLAERFQLVPPFGATTLNQFLINLGLPSLIFLGIAECRPEDLNHGAFLVGFSLCLFVTFGLLVPVFRHLKAGYREGVMLSMLASFPNVVLVGLPVLMALYPGEAQVVLASTLTNILEIPIILVALLILVNNGARGRHPMRTVGITLLTNPVVLSTACGALFYVTGTAVPLFLEAACRALGNSVMPCALVSLGIVMSARLRGGRAFPPRQTGSRPHRQAACSAGHRMGSTDAARCRTPVAVHGGAACRHAHRHTGLCHERFLQGGGG